MGESVLTMASTKTVLRLAGKRPLGTAAQLSRGAQRASLSHSSKRCAEKDDTAQRLREAAPDLLSELRKAPRRPMGKLSAPIVNDADKYADKATPLHKYGQQFSVWKDELCIYITPTGVIPVFTFLKYHTAAEYTMVSDITAVDFPTKNYRFEVVYNMLSVRHNSRI